MGHNAFQHLYTSSLKGGNLGWILWPGSGPHGLYRGTDFGDSSFLVVIVMVVQFVPVGGYLKLVGFVVVLLVLVLLANQMVCGCCEGDGA